MRFFQQNLLPEPLGPLLAAARRRSRLSLEDASRAAGIPGEEAQALEQDAFLDPAVARLHAVSYARAVGIDPVTIRDSLPPGPELMRGRGGYLAALGRPLFSRWRAPGTLLAPVLAPLGRVAVLLLLGATLLSTWEIMRQLSRIRSIPWVTANSHPVPFSTR
jgi:hypothetical protein